MFLLNHSVNPNRTYGKGKLRIKPDSLAGDRGDHPHARGAERHREFLDGILDLGYWPDRFQEAAVVLGALYLGIQCTRQHTVKVVIG